MGRHSAQGMGLEQFVRAEVRTPGPRSRALMMERGAVSEAVQAALATRPQATGTAFQAPAAVEDTAANAQLSAFPLSRRGVAALGAVLLAGSGIGLMSHMSMPANAYADGFPVARAAGATVSEYSFTVNFEGEERTLTTTAGTLGEALQEAGITVSGDDVVSQSLAEAVTPGAKVTITRVEKRVVTEEVVDAHGSTKVDDAALAKGTTKVETEGKDGISANTYEIRVENGKEVARTLTFSAVKQARMDEVVKVGTSESAAAVAGASGDAGSAALGSASVVPAGTAQEIASGMLSAYGWGQDQFSCLVTLWNRESNWNHLAENSSSGAYGIPQALPGSKMASAGADWQTNPATQIRWGLGYIEGRYGSPCAALGHSNSRGWY
ncbi:G5 domain-containing protein [Actinotignum sp. GS-2025b]|uniref:aggregation-promoting factor C-terminal-like domain-containing protein n=1 Tax=Actinotignum sp. GS-2025b TaxID=3427275 RepID=UPI003F479991